MAAIVRSLLLAAELARFSRNDRALLARCPRHIQSVFNLIEDIVLWSIGSCQLRYPPTSVTKLYRELKCRTHLICWPVIDFNLSLFQLLPVFYINSVFWSIGSCQLRYPPTSVTKLYRELKCRTHLICWPVIDFNLSLFQLLPVFYINSAKGPYNE